MIIILYYMYLTLLVADHFVIKSFNAMSVIKLHFGPRFAPDAWQMLVHYWHLRTAVGLAVKKGSPDQLNL